MTDARDATTAPERIHARTKGQDGGGVWTTAAIGDTEYVRADLYEEAIEALRAAEWSERWEEEESHPRLGVVKRTQYRRCPICTGSPSQMGHRPDCVIGNTLSRHAERATPKDG